MGIEEALAELRAHGAVEVTVRFVLSPALPLAGASSLSPLASTLTPPEGDASATADPDEEVDEFSGSGFRPLPRDKRKRQEDSDG